ncbi:hypothetical protein CsSME_00005993 [Camellia sinensis var. sinensis]|uniref:BZIP domain-containing protein n=1 Tax=Camellia sinensis TaxID=4442 RepID=A0A7J7G3J1_CAMSI|nr:hypothetical protein HYC85_030762 [Camellia sinensis]
MDEVWNDITLASLHDPPTLRDDPARDTHFRSLTFQDFLGRPVNKNPPARISGGDGSPASPPSTTSLNLNSLPDQLNLLSSNESDPMRANYGGLESRPVSSEASLNVLFDALASSSSSLQALGKKRFPESESSSGDRRHKRMIKNRESAARSRARKQERISLLFSSIHSIYYTYRYNTYLYSRGVGK